MNKLTVVIPNYNRPLALTRALESIFRSIDKAGASEEVTVLVVDDYSTQDLTSAIAPFQDRSNFQFRYQKLRCGNAEKAFLSAIQQVETEYYWLFGNDDQMLGEGIARVLHVIGSHAPHFILLNPILSLPNGKHHTPLDATAPMIQYQRVHDLFMDFGFVTSTTTFPCLIGRAEPLKSFYVSNDLTTSATVYSHSFSLYVASKEHPGIFIAKPLVVFSENLRDEEYSKLAKQAPGGLSHYHQTVGLARLIRRASLLSGTTVKELGTALEDEISKDTLEIKSSSLASFVTRFIISQLMIEQLDLQRSRPRGSYITRVELDEIGEVIRDFDNDELNYHFRTAIEIYKLSSRSAEWKLRALGVLLQDVWQIPFKNSIEKPLVRKIDVKGGRLSPMRGVPIASQRFAISPK